MNDIPKDPFEDIEKENEGIPLEDQVTPYAVVGFLTEIAHGYSQFLNQVEWTDIPGERLENPHLAVTIGGYTYRFFGPVDALIKMRDDSRLANYSPLLVK